MTITFVGHGYVGLVTAAVFADLGNTVWVIGHTKEKVDNLKKGIIPIYEPGLEDVVKRNVKAGRLIFTLDYKEAVSSSSVIFIAVGTPPKENGEADLSVVFDVAKKIGENLKSYAVVVTKSTVPMGTNKKVKAIIEESKSKDVVFDIGSVPEFLREGVALSDTLHPDRVVIGTENNKARDLLTQLHKPIDGTFILTNIETAEMIKYAANAFLATKISFANAIAQLSELSKADGIEVLKAVGLDKRVGSAFLSPGAGFGGSCFPKDLKALIKIAKSYNYDFSLLKDVEKINNDAMINIVKKAQILLEKMSGKTICILGLSFKPDTDDMRDAPSIVIINSLLTMGSKIKVYDPIAMEKAKGIIKGVEFCKDVYSAASGSDLIIVVTEWNEFREIDFAKIKNLMKTPFLIDGRNIYNPQKMVELGFVYKGVGR